MKKDEFWAIIDKRGRILHWTLSWWRYNSIHEACRALIKRGMTRKAAWAKRKREWGCRISKVQLMEKGTGWISVEERLPEPNVLVLTWPYPPYPHESLISRYLKDDGAWFFDAFPVTHWMPLPEPPEVKP